MKKTLLACFVSSLFYAADAQVEKGSIFTGGSIGFGKMKTDDLASNLTNSSGWNISPQIGIATKLNQVMGVQLLFSGNSNQNKYSPGLIMKTTNHNYGLGVFYRKFFPLHDRWMLFGQGALTGTRLTSNTYSNDGLIARSKGINAVLGVSPGVTYRAGKKLFLELALNDLLSVSYQRYKTDRLDGFNTIINKEKSTNFSAGANANGFSNLNVGLRWIFPRA